jgi:hypothetical protein
MLRALRAGAEDVAKLADRALGRWRAKIPQRRLAREGHCREPHRYRLGRLLSHRGSWERQTEERSGRIAERRDALLPAAAQQRRDRIPGIHRQTIETIRAETGVDLAVFPDEPHLASWWGMGPGNEESARRRLRSRTRPGNRWLRRALTEAAWAASAVKASDLRAQFRRRAARRGKNRALVAVGPSLLVILDPVLNDNLEDPDLGPDDFDRLEPERLRRDLVKRLQALGDDGTLSPKDPPGCAAEHRQPPGHPKPQPELGPLPVRALIPGVGRDFRSSPALRRKGPAEPGTPTRHLKDRTLVGYTRPPKP